MCQLWLQLVGALFIIGYNTFITSLILIFIRYVLRVPLRMTEEQLLVGDDMIHGEDAYCFTDDPLLDTEGVSPSGDLETATPANNGGIEEAPKEK